MKIQINWDVLGVSATLACAIHCALLPLFLTSVPLMGINIIHNLVFEVIMVVLAAGIGGYSLWHGLRRHHHRILPLILFSAGMLFLIARVFIFHSGTWLLIPAVFFIILGHFLNWRFCRLAKHCHASDCNH